jgi:hypothetical protein
MSNRTLQCICTELSQLGFLQNVNKINDVWCCDGSTITNVSEELYEVWYDDMTDERILVFKVFNSLVKGIGFL